MIKTSVVKIDPLKPDKAKIKQAAKIINQGGIVCLPTETVYGLAVNLENKAAIDRLYEIKRRPINKPFSIHIAQFDKIEELATDISATAYKLIYKFWPGPLTLILKAKADSKPSFKPDSGSGSKSGSKVGLRMPRNKIALAIISEAQVPVVIPSANIAGKAPPATLDVALTDFNGLIEMAIDSGQTELGIESTLVDASSATVQILRQGALSQTEIEEVTRLKTVLFICTGNSCRSVMAKSLLEKNLTNRSDVEVRSVGTGALTGMPASRETIELLKQEGIDVSGHRAQALSDEVIRVADLILVMEKRHEVNIIERFPQARKKLYLLKEFAKLGSTSLDIADPIGKSMEFYREVFSIIKESVKKVTQLL